MFMEYELNIDDIREEIQNMSDEEKKEYLTGKRIEIDGQIDELESFRVEIDELVAEIGNKIEDKWKQDIRREIRKALDSIKLDIPVLWDSNEKLTTHIGDVTIIILIYRDEIKVYNERTLKHGLSYRELMKNVLACSKFDGNLYNFAIVDKSHKEVLTDILTALSNSKEKFEEIAGK